MQNNIIKKIEKGEFKLWLHPNQIRDVVKGTEIKKYLEDNNLMENCATKEDLEEIKKQGVEFYRKNFGYKIIYAWKSVVLHDVGNLCVPYLCEYDDRVVLLWDWAVSDWYDYGPALRFASSPKSSDTNSSSDPLSLRQKLEVYKKPDITLPKFYPSAEYNLGELRGWNDAIDFISGLYLEK